MAKWLPYVIDISSLLIWLKWQIVRFSKLSKYQWLTIVSVLIYIMIVSYLTVAPTSYAFVSNQQVAPLMLGAAPINLIPFWSTTADFYQNVLMMLPAGVYIGLLSQHLKWYQVLLIGSTVSLGIEGLQLILDLTVGLSRWVDINDVITNTLGVLVGWLILYLLNRTLFKGLIRFFTIANFKIFS